MSGDIIFFVFILLFFTSLPITILVWQAKRRRRRIKEIATTVTGDQSQSGQELSGTIDGYSYKVQFIAPAKNRPAALKLELQSTTPICLVVEREGRLHRMSKRIQLVDELESPDAEFNRTFFCEASSRNLLRELLNESEYREKIKLLFSMHRGVRQLKLEKQKLRLEITHCDWQGDGVEQLIKDSLGTLRDLLKLIEQRAMLFGRTGMLTGRIPMITQMVSLGFVMAVAPIVIKSFSYPAVNHSLFTRYLSWGVVAAGMLTMLTYQLCRFRFRAVPYFYGAVSCLVVASMAAGIFFPSFANGWWDQSTPYYKEAMVTNKRKYRDKGKNRYYFSVLHDQEREIELRCNARNYAKIEPHSTMVTLTLKAGALNVPWIAGYRLNP